MSKAIENPALGVAISDEEQPQPSETNSVSKVAESSSEKWDTFGFMSLTAKQKEKVVKAMIKCLQRPVPEPPKNPLFELFSVCVEYNNPERRAELFGLVEAKDESNTYPLFDLEENESVSICNKEFISLKGPSRSISAAGELEVLIQLDVKIDGEEFELNNTVYEWDFSRIFSKSSYDKPLSVVSPGKDGSVTFYCIALERAVQVTLEATLTTPNGSPLDVYGTIVAYYGNFNFDYWCEPNEKEFYRVTLFKRPKNKPSLLNNGSIQLSRYVVTVPAEFSLVIEAHLWESGSGVQIFGDTMTFPAKLKGSSNGCIKGQGCSLDMKADWHCDASP